MTVLLDSSAWLEYFFGSAKGRIVQAIVDTADEPIVLSKINVFEVYHKILKERGKEDAERFTRFMVSRALLDDLNVDTLKFAAEEKKTYNLVMADAIILATAVHHDAILYTGDSDFMAVQKVINVVML